MNTPFFDSLAQRTRNFVLIVLSLLFVCVILWIIISLFSSQQASKIPESSKKLADPLNPVLDTSQLGKISTKVYYSPEELQSFPINIIQTDEKTRAKRVIRVPAP